MKLPHSSGSFHDISGLCLQRTAVSSQVNTPTSLDDRKSWPVLHKTATLPSFILTSANNSFVPKSPSVVSRVIEEPELSFVEEDGVDTECLKSRWIATLTSSPIGY